MNGSNIVYEPSFENPNVKLSASRLKVNSQSAVSVKAALGSLKLKTIQAPE